MNESLSDSHGTSPRRLLVVGAGFIGTAIGCAAAQRGLHVRLFGRSLPERLPQSLLHRIELVRGDANHEAQLTLALDGITDVVYAVGELRRGIDVNLATHLVNTLVPLVACLDACASRGGVTFTFISSGGTVYGEPLHLPIAEDHPTNPLSPYGIAMLTCEKYVLATARQHNMRAAIIRCANAYGENQPSNRPQGLIAALVYRLMHAEPITIYGDGSIVRDFVFVNDVAQAIIDLICTNKNIGIMNIGSGIGTSLQDVLCIIEEISSAKFRVVYETPRFIDVTSNILDISKLQGLVCFSPIPLRAGIALTLSKFLRIRAEAPDTAAGGY